MLSANKSRFFSKLFSIYNEKYLLDRRFSYVGISGQLDVAEKERPVLYIMNHSSWWDGLLVHHALHRLSSCEHYMMMEEEQLKKFTFFRKLGAYSIRKGDTGEVRQTLNYTLELLSSGKKVWIFPQGEIRHQDVRPLGFERGIGLLLSRLPETIVMPVTLVHGLYCQDKPEAMLTVGLPIIQPWSDYTSREITQRLEDVLTEQLERQKQEIIAAPDGRPAEYISLIEHKKSTSDRFEKVFVKRGGA
ncbi:lysophospholipid acyltransferase family protein [Neobacillus mesonae]|nr:lysophospholipid acyltransferase family protein [Neobacillus mesonae]